MKKRNIDGYFLRWFSHSIHAPFIEGFRFLSLRFLLRDKYWLSRNTLVYTCTCCPARYHTAGRITGPRTSLAAVYGFNSHGRPGNECLRRQCHYPIKWQVQLSVTFASLVSKEWKYPIRILTIHRSDLYQQHT